MTRHGIRPFSASGGKRERHSEGSTDVMMTDAEKAATEVILGVDTHPLDVHVAVALDHLGERLGELSVPTTAKGYERLAA